MSKSKQHPEFYIAFHEGITPSQLIAKGFNRHSVYNYFRRYNKEVKNTFQDVMVEKEKINKSSSWSQWENNKIVEEIRKAKTSTNQVRTNFFLSSYFLILASVVVGDYSLFGNNWLSFKLALIALLTYSYGKEMK